MFDKKNSSERRAGVGLVLALILCGCTPAGPGALKKGMKLLDEGDNDGAYAQLKLAATLIKTNAVVWDYYGVAAQRDGQPVDAANAYLKALDLDRDLVEAHFNLGCLYLEQNQPEAARSELVAYTIRRPNEAEGWRKLGSAQLRLGETASAERSFSAVLKLKPNEQDAEAYNGLGLACIQRGHPHDAERYFAAAIQVQPDYGTAMLNLAATAQEYLRDKTTALYYYQKYLALTPHPANWDQVNAIVQSLQPAAPVAPVATVPPPAPTNLAPVTPALAVAPEVQAAAQAPQPAAHPATPYYTPLPPARTAPSSAPAPAAPAPRYAPQVVHLAPEPAMVVSPGAPPARPAAATGTTEEPTVSVVSDPDKTPATPKPSLWQRLKPSNWFQDQPEPEVNSEFVQSGVTPLTKPDAASGAHTPDQVVVPTTPVTPYQYLNPAPPVTGDHRAANGAYTKAQIYEQDEDWGDAMVWYGEAADYDPAWYQAHYNEGVLAQRTRNLGRALKAYEWALAIRPDSLDARYNFALTLKAASHPNDAVNELQKIIAAHPDEVRAHLALANLYAQTLHEPRRARAEYFKVLQLAPNHPQSAVIRTWLNSN